MAAYNGVSFTPVADKAGVLPDWEQAVRIVTHPVPGANKEIVQSTGRGNFRLVLAVTLANATALTTLQASQGATRRTLTDPFGDGVNEANVMLVGVTDVRRHSGGTRLCTLVFEKAGS